MKSRAADAVLGLCYIAVVAALVLVVALVYNKTFVDRVSVQLSTGDVGNALRQGSDVKVNGVPVGQVDKIEATGDGAMVTLSLDPAKTPSISRDSSARLLPKTLFGERFVSLVAPASGSTGSLQDGDSIAQDQSAEAVELEQVFDDLLPMLQAVQPAKLSATLSELSTALRDEGGKIGDSMEAWQAYLHKLNPLVPQMTDRLAALGRVATNYEQAVPDLVSALDNMTVTSQTLVDQRRELSNVFASVTTSSDSGRGWLTSNEDTIVILSEESRTALSAVEPYAAQFPCLLKAMRDFIPKMDETLGVGTDEPGLHVVLNVVPPRGKYIPGVDVPTFRTGGEATCPYVQGSVGTTPAVASTNVVDRQPAAGAGLGMANSPAENQLTAELIAPTQGLSPDAFPVWGSLLLGPTLRNTKVTLK